MTTPVPADKTQDAPALFSAGVSALVTEAKRLGISWNLTLATVIDETAPTVVCDGDSENITVVSMVGSLYQDQRVYILQVPPSGNFVVGSLVPSYEAPWTPWVPTLFNWTLGSGTVVARYKKLGKTVTIYFRFTYGSGSTIGSSPNFTLPFALRSSYNDEAALPFGGEIRDAGLAARQAHIAYGNSLQIIVNYWNATPAPAQTTATTPWVWGVGDRIVVWGTYETV